MIHSVLQLHLPMFVFVSLFGHMCVRVVSEHLPDLVQFFSERANVKKVFTKQSTATLPTHQCFNCTVDLLPNTTLLLDEGCTH